MNLGQPRTINHNQDHEHIQTHDHTPTNNNQNHNSDADTDNSNQHNMNGDHNKRDNGSYTMATTLKKTRRTTTRVMTA